MPPRRSKRWRDKFIEGRQADQAAFRKADPFIKARPIKLAVLASQSQRGRLCIRPPAFNPDQIRLRLAQRSLR